ncbi:Uncharacterized protein dnm_089540 [Desulfonema magnum]|uniref:Uncharacterized protein n=1 Tax=Desulfonema magnum TaxID=45655 RepID=A0A975GT99_9BACT|nr:Uncharacterized protein dnm_089540 [Desulfonema magnum]
MPNSVDRKVFGLSRDRHGERGRNPAFSGGGSLLSGGKKAGFLCHAAHSPETFRSTETVSLALLLIYFPCEGRKNPAFSCEGERASSREKTRVYFPVCQTVSLALLLNIKAANHHMGDQ